MLFARRVLVCALGVSGIAGFAIGQPVQEPSDPIPNWTAPPFWTPPKAAEAELLKPETGLSPEAVEVLPSPPLPFVAISPCRLLDTRPPANNPLDGDGIFGANEIRTYTLPGACELPAGIQAVSLNVTATNTGAGAFGHIKVWPADGTEPNVSTLNYPGAAATVANAAVVPLSTTGAMRAKSGNAGADLILDINGYYAPVAIVNTVNGISGAVTLAAGTNISITPAGNTLTIAASGGAAGWSLTGNAGTAPGTNFLGTTDNQRLEIKVNNQRVMRYEPHATSPNVVGGFSGNSVTATVHGATIGGGGQNLSENRVTDVGGTVAGGFHNQAGDNAGSVSDRLYATVGGGLNNTASGSSTTVAGGDANTATGVVGATVSGGKSNTASGESATICGGEFHTASGDLAIVAGGFNNTAAGNYSFAAGRQVQANHAGAFVWGDSTFAATPMASTGVNQFIVRASGGIWLGTTSTPSIPVTDFLNTSTGAHLTTGGAWTDNSDVNSKENFRDVDRRDVLARLASLPITRWNYKAEGCEVEHLGPMAQDFSAAFGLGSDDRSISTLDSSGVALAAIQALYEEVQELRKRLAALEGGKD